MKTKNRPRPFFRMEGGHSLCGTVKVQGSKNAALPVLAATLLMEDTCRILNCPNISDIECMKTLLQEVGCLVKNCGHTCEVNATTVSETWFPKREMKKMRSSIILLGAMLARKKEAQVYYPGGCLLGERPIDLHLAALEKLGAKIVQEKDMLCASCKELKGCEIKFPFPSVGATQNVLLAAVTAVGETTIVHAAKEPEICVLCEFLKKAGADIEGYGTDVISIRGVKTLHGTSFQIPSDRIVAGTYLFGALGTGGHIVLENAPIEHMEKTLETIQQMGGTITCDKAKRTIELLSDRRPCNLERLETASYPGFPTDLQSSLLTTACVSEGKLVLKDTIFGQRFRIVEELERMGARISLQDGGCTIEGVKELAGRNVIARELRGGAALVEAGLIAEGITTVFDIGFVERGYEDIVRDYKSLGAKIEKGC